MRHLYSHYRCFSKLVFRVLTMTIILLISSFFLAACQTSKQDLPAENEPIQEQMEIAILMPMSGPNADLGKQYSKLIKMGLEDGLKTYAHVTSYDCSDEKHVPQIMSKIIARKTKVILGPIYSNIASAIALRAKQNNIIIITLSNNPALADVQLFVFGHAPLKQLTRIINYFADNEYKDFIAFLPAGQHSRTVNQIIQEIAIQKNATLVRSEFYANLPESIEKSVAIIENTVDNINEMEDKLRKPVVYIADDSKNLNLIFNSIKKHNLDKKAIIVGDNRIDIDYEDNISIIFTGSLNVLNTNLMVRAKELAIPHLSFMHIMAYDLGRMTASYIGTKFVSEEFLARLNSGKLYLGVSGNIRFVDSIAQREYDIIKKEEGVYTTLSSNKEDS